MIIHQISLSKAYPSNLYLKSQSLTQKHTHPISTSKAKVLNKKYREKIFKESSGHQRKVK